MENGKEGSIPPLAQKNLSASFVVQILRIPRIKTGVYVRFELYIKKNLSPLSEPPA